MKWINKTYFYIVFCILAVCFSQIAIASEAKYHFGAGLMAFGYAEYDDSNVFIDGETGLIPGLVLKRKKNYRRVYTELVGQVYGNSILYDGKTQPGGIPIKTDSIAIIIDTHFKFGLRFTRKQGPYIGLGYRYWYRNILAGQDINGTNVSGLLEHYYWFYGMLGYTLNFNVTDNINIGFDLRSTQMFNAKMDVPGNSGSDYFSVNLGNRLGARFALPVKIKVGKSTLRSITVTPYYEIIDIGKSNIVPITDGGIPSGVGWEPRSETRNVGVEITWLW